MFRKKVDSESYNEIAESPLCIIYPLLELRKQNPDVIYTRFFMDTSL